MPMMNADLALYNAIAPRILPVDIIAFWGADADLRIPRDADQRSELMSISIPK
jgi:hypothetical protein